MRQNVGLPFVALLTTLAAFVALPPTDARGEGRGSTLLRNLEKQGDLLRAQKVDGSLPIEADDAKWRAANEYTVPLVSQFAVAPRSPEFSRSEIRVRALYNDKELALLLVSADPTRNDHVTNAGLFGDAIAVGFPTEYGKDVPLPYIGMGNKGRPVNVWQWKAVWQADIERGYQGIEEAYPNRVPNVRAIQYLTGAEAGSPLSQESRTSPVENLLAEGFGTLTSTASRGLNGKGIYRDGAWQVVIKRPLRPDGVGSRIDAEAGLLPFTFAVWDGAAAQRNGMKGVTRWRFLAFSDEKVSSEGADVVASFAGADAQRGKKLVDDMGCASCHQLPGLPPAENVGPDLTHAGAIHRPGYLLESIKDPNAVIVPAPGYLDPATGMSTMPEYGELLEDDDDPTSKMLKDEDYRDMAQYLWSLQ